MNRTAILPIALLLIGLVFFGILGVYADSVFWFPLRPDPEPPQMTTSDLSFSDMGNFRFAFDQTSVVEEAGSEGESSHIFWWVDSGAELVIKNGIGMTLSGELDEHSRWRSAYQEGETAIDTDNGAHPQSLFRLLTRVRWRNTSEEAYFKMTRYYPNKSFNRNESNGIFLFTRYQDDDNTYYAGIRVDGQAVVKKKVSGVYETLAIQPWITGEKYDHDLKPNLIPEDAWIGLRAMTETTENGGVHIRLYTDREGKGEWKLAIDATDEGKGSPTLTKDGMLGIRSDFMDLQFDNFKVVAL